MAEPIEFYFDFSSPYGYIASHLIDSVAARHGRTVRWRPILLGAIFKITGMQPLVDIPVKGEYTKRDFARSARQHGIAWQLPASFPFSGVSANRAFYRLDSSDPARTHDLARTLYDGVFAQGKSIANAEEVADAAAGAGLSRDVVLAGLQSAAAKERTRAENDAALAKGVFGSPYFIVDGEPFWGADRLGQLEQWLDTGGW